MKYCTNCGKENEDQVKFCSACGKEFGENATEEGVVAVQPVFQVKPKKNSGMAIAGFVLSLVGVLIIPILFGALGCAFSGVGLAQTSKGALKGKGLAIAGLIIGAFNIGYGIVATLMQ